VQHALFYFLRHLTRDRIPAIRINVSASSATWETRIPVRHVHRIAGR
jgi:hypothetical protein